MTFAKLFIFLLVAILIALFLYEVLGLRDIALISAAGVISVLITTVMVLRDFMKDKE